MFYIKKQIRNFCEMGFLKYKVLSIFLIISFSIFAPSVSAFTLSPQVVSDYINYPVISVATGDELGFDILYFEVFDVSTGLFLTNTNASNPSEISILDIDTSTSHDYYIVGVQGQDYYCSGGGTYEECSATGTIVSQQILSFVPAILNSGLGQDEVSNSSVGKYSLYLPTVKILSPAKGSALSKITNIKYEATDINDTGSDYEKNSAGLSEKAVSLFYSDKIADWDYSVVDKLFKTFIIDGLSPVGSYNWSTTNLIPGVFYRIIVDALDREGNIGEAVSDLFVVDYTSPVFSIKTDPPAIRQGDIKISVKSSEDLSSIPNISVRQNGGKVVPIKVTGEGMNFEGVYTVLPNYDGTAKVFVSGTDKAGNNGTTTISGGTFSVGQNPPPKPVITFPTNKVSINEDTITIKGTTRDDTEVLLEINGTQISTSKPDSIGNFVFSKVSLEKEKNQGVNFINVIARDAVGTLSESSSIEVKRNIPPEVKLLKPINNETVGDQVSIVAEGKDGNGDTVLYSYEIQSGKSVSSRPWTSVGEKLTSSGLSWNASEVEDGDYMLRVIADDGTAQATSTPVHILVRNTLSFLRFENGRRTVTKENVVTLYAQAISSKNLSTRSVVESVEYSLDRGVKWIPIKLTNTGTVYERRFSVTLPPLKEGINPILWRTTDDRGLVGKTTHLVIVDKTSPQKPTLSFPQNGQILSSENDEDTNQKGMQVDFEGQSEPGSVVSLSFGEIKATTKTLASGKFVFSNITFPNRGKYEVSLFTTDVAGNKGSSSVISLTYDNPPVITFINPKPFRGLSGQAHVLWKINDPDGDVLKDTTLSYRKGSGAWKTLAQNAGATGDFLWDVSNFSQGNDYELRLTTSDGLIPTSLISSFSIDRVSPSVISLDVDSKSLRGDNVGFLAGGEARDDVSGIETVEYSLLSKRINEQSLWYQSIITKGFSQKTAQYSIKYPFSLEDGLYTLSVRAVDTAGNVSSEVSKTFSVDKTAPRIGSFFIETNRVRLTPDEKGRLSVPKDNVFTLGVSVEGDAEKAEAGFGIDKIILKKDLSTGLWTGLLSVKGSTTTNLSISAEDGSGNVTLSKEIGDLESVSGGSVYSINKKGEKIPISGASIRVLKLNEETQEFVTFINSAGESLRVVSATDGSYDLALPQGSYKLIMTTLGFKSVEEKITLERSEFVNVSFITESVSGVRAWLENLLEWIRF
jgi:hypothetical protein